MLKRIWWNSLALFLIVNLVIHTILSNLREPLFAVKMQQLSIYKEQLNYTLGLTLPPPV